MWELLLPGATLFLVFHDDNRCKTDRKTKWSLVAVLRPSDGTLIPLVPAGANRIAKEVILPHMFPRARRIRPEVSIGRSRLDFIVESDPKDTLVEVKSCTLESHRVAMFPDAVTARGTRHVTELTDLTSYDRLVLFVIQGPKVTRFVPDLHTDPRFAVVLRTAKNAGVEIRAIETDTTIDGTTTVTNWNVPVDFDPIAAVDTNSGSYIVHVRIDRPTPVTVGSLGYVEFAPGHYLYVGSAMGTLDRRTDRHRRKRKRLRWHIDYLRSEAVAVAVYRIYSLHRLECDLARSLGQVYSEPVVGFGSSDCACPSHLFFSPDDPTKDSSFIKILLAYRHRYAITP